MAARRPAGKGKGGPDSSLYTVILAGGKGTRFWPLSREAFPKQFLNILGGDRTLMQETLLRLGGLVKPSNYLIVTTHAQKDIVDWQVDKTLKGARSVVEPEGKNTAPAIALAAFKLYKKNKDALVLVLPSDHYVGDSKEFVSTVKKAARVAAGGRIVTFGIKPTRPETGYGYIRAGRKTKDGAYRVSAFVEKPDLRKARAFLKAGSYYWNSGMFLFRAGDMIDEIRRHLPAMYEAFDAIRGALNTSREELALGKTYSSLEDVSIDYGVMEKSKRVSMVTADFSWSDLGSWTSLDEMFDKDHNGNVVVGNVVESGSRDTIFFTGKRLVAAIGLRNMVVVDTADATLICPKDRVQRVKDLVARLKDEQKDEYLAPMLEERPWGHFSVLEKGVKHKIKHISVKPGGRLSLQMHNHRSEHWIVVSGTAKVKRAEETFFVHENESTFIPATVVHRLENPGTIPLRIIEIQSGEYLGEDDIIRIDDRYGRKK